MDADVGAPTASLRQLFRKLATRILPGKNATEQRLRRRKAIVSIFTAHLSRLITLLFLIGYLWMALIPLPLLARGTYIDENALQPAQVNTYWNWVDVHAADTYLHALERLQNENATSEERAQMLKAEFHKIGIPASTQNYTITGSSKQLEGTNAYAVLPSPRTAGTEALVISASWLSRTGASNLRGISTVLALASFLKRYSLWAKDIVFVVSDGHLEGMHAWLSAYHGNLKPASRVDPLELSSGIIWTALNIDYPGHSFSHLGIFFEGINGRLPNQDFLNSFQRISLYTGGVPVVLHDYLDGTESTFSPTWLPRFIHDQPGFQSFVYHAKNVLHQFIYQARGRPSGVHGLFHQHRIDAFTLFAVPATGPHGFHAIGRIVESTLRTANNLLERLHASFFFYMLTSPDHFMKIGSYLPSAVLISIALMISGLRTWVDASWEEQTPAASTDPPTASTPQWRERRRPLLEVIYLLVSTYVIGMILFGILTTSWFMKNQTLFTPLVFVVFSHLPLLVLFVRRGYSPEVASPSTILKALNLCSASAVISVISLLNFPFAACLAVLLGIPLSISSSNGPLSSRVACYAIYVALGLGWLFLYTEVQEAAWDWETLSVWFAPIICLIYVPLVLQAGLVCLLPP